MDLVGRETEARCLAEAYPGVQIPCSQNMAGTTGCHCPSSTSKIVEALVMMKGKIRKGFSLKFGSLWFTKLLRKLQICA